MSKMWYVIKKFDDSDPGNIALEIQVPADSHWFAGHFPGEPILPGIAQLGMVCDAIKRSARGQLMVTGVRRVRFKQIIRPDDLLHLTVTPQKDGSGAYEFRILANAELACSGTMTVASRS